MDARRMSAAVMAAALASLGAGYRTTNFIVEAPTPQLAREIGDAAETFRRELALEWIGKAMPPWAQPCMVTAQVSADLGAGGATSFVFDGGEVYGWRMTIQGSRERILDSVLPHEVTHTVFACHFRQALPRWADEGACTTVEHASEREKQQKMLITFLKTGRGISFTRMFAMKDYPKDIMPLYSQGYSLARYLIGQHGKKKFLEFLETGMQDENWENALKSHYGYDSLLALQNTWLGWVRQGSPALAGPQTPTVLASAEGSRPARPAANLIHRSPSAGASRALASAPLVPVHKPARTVAASPSSNSGWRARGSAPQAPPVEHVAAQARQMARPPAAESSRQIILQWDESSRASNSAGAPSPRQPILDAAAGSTTIRR